MKDPLTKTCNYYNVRYESESCMDWGDEIHESGWVTINKRIVANTDKQAVNQARKIVVDAKGKPCGSFQCGNKGRTRLVSVEHVIHGNRIVYPVPVPFDVPVPS